MHSWSIGEFRQQWCISENSTQVYTMSTHDDYHKSGKMQVGDHLVENKGSLKKRKCIHGALVSSGSNGASVKIVHRCIQ